MKILAIAALMASAVLGQITVYSSGSLAIGTTKQLTAYVPLVVNTVTWSVNGVVGGNSTYGTVSTTGLYSAPAVVPMANAVSVRATSTADSSKFGSVTLTITQPAVQLWSTSPTSVPVGPFTISLNGSNFGANSVTTLGGVALTTKVNSATSISASGTATAAQIGTTLAVVVTNTGLGGTTSGSVNLKITAAPPVTVTVAPTNAGVPVTTTKQFNATVTGSSNTAVTWSVNGTVGGNAATVGTISASGLYKAPAAVPSPASVTIQATSAANPSSVGSATVTIQPPAPPPVTVSVAPTNISVAPSATQLFKATVTNSVDTSVTWSVNGIAGGSAAVGTISVAGLFTAPSAPPNPANVTIKATSVASPSSSASTTVNIVGPPNPGPGLGTPNLAAGRFLEQATFGPTTADLAHLKQVGINAWLSEQFNLPETQIVDPGSMNSGALQSQYLARLSSAPDQLRQRVANALGQVIVISMNKNIYPDEMVPYLQILSRNAFGSYRTLLGEISTSSQMGMYLDLAGSTKTGAAGANENYAREVMQLFSIGLYMLNLDGTLQLDGMGNPIPTYNQTTIQQVALALTGWIYINNAWQDFSGPMVPLEANHDKSQKTYLGCTAAAGQNVTTDMNAFLDCLFKHPNVAPFVATRLIRSMVTSNPTPGYIARVATVFNNNGQGVRGDMKAVVTAVLTDAEARNDTATPTSGRLKDPMYHAISFVRTLNGAMSPTNGLPWVFSRMAQTPLTPPSVFSFYSPLYRIPLSPYFGPEFQIYTPTESILRGNFLWEIISNPATDMSPSLSPFTSVAGNTQQLIDAVDQALLYGRMPAQMRQSLANAIVAQSDNNSRAQTALYLTALSGFYAVQY